MVRTDKFKKFEKFKENKMYMLKAIRKDESAYNFASIKLKTDKDFVKAAIYANWRVYHTAMKFFPNDKKFKFNSLMNAKKYENIEFAKQYEIKKTDFVKGEKVYKNFYKGKLLTNDKK